jgi:hypothetical protein
MIIDWDNFVNKTSILIAGIIAISIENLDKVSASMNGE